MKKNNLRLVTLVFLVILFCFCIQIAGLASDTPEIPFADGVPLAPNVMPVIFISGSDYEMGYQWYQQMIQIYGPWILTTKPGCQRPDCHFYYQSYDFSEEELKALKAFQMYIRKHAPEMLEMFQGMADGATDAGVPLTYTEVLAQWTAAEVFPSPPPLESAQEKLSPDCSGFAAWGSATRDGDTVCATSTDHNPQPEVTVIALPTEGGNSFIFAPFNPVGGSPGTGWRPKLGPPALNNQGLVYIREPDVPSRPEAEWTYGIPPGISTIHAIRFANNSKEALDMILGFPSSDGFAGGFWADIDGNGWYIESRDDNVIRRAGDLGEVDFLYVTNNALSPKSGEYREMVPGAEGGGTLYIKHGGWADPAAIAGSLSSVSRNLQLWNMLNYYHGQVDFEFAKMMYRFSGDPNPGSPVLDLSLGNATADDYNIFEKADLKKNIGGVHNEKVCVVLPEKLEYYVCQGYPGKQAYPPIGRAAYPVDPLHSFYQLKLEPSIPEITNAALTQAAYELIRADRELMKLSYFNPAFAPLKEIFEKATIERRKGESYQFYAKNTEGNDSIYNWGKALRSYTKCQAYAQHVYEALVTPPHTPEDLFLKPWGYWVETIR
jgi:hypothetical protein